MRRSRAGGILVAAASVVCALVGRAGAQAQPQPLARPPSIQETGRVAEAPVTERRVQIQAAQPDRSQRREVRIDPAPPPRPDAPATAAGRINTPVLAREIRSRFARLADCPADVARHKRLSKSAASAGRFTLRWTILPSGRVTDTAIVAISPGNPDVMDCLKRQLSSWSFSPPEGGPIRVERPFRFRAR